MSNERRDSGSRPATKSDIAACEAAIGVDLPDWMRERLARENGWHVDDSAGATREQWHFLPVVDRSDRKSRNKTAEDIAWHTLTLRRQASDAAVPLGAVVVAVGRTASTRLILMPDEATVLLPTLRRQNGVAAPMPMEINPAALGASLAEVPDVPFRARDELPTFRYHPDPVATGSIARNIASTCSCCGLRTGWVYQTVPYGPGDQPDSLCPWCIGDGRAAERFGSEFVSEIDGLVPEAVADEVLRRTPGFVSWHGERWLAHCDDAAAFLGPAGWSVLQQHPQIVRSLLDEWDEDVLASISEDGDLAGYLFRCLHCGTHLGYADAS